MDSEKSKTSTGVTWMDHELGILRFVYTEGAVCKLAQAKENVEVQTRAMGGKTVPILVDVTKAKEVDGEARAYYAASKGISAMALVTNTPISNVIANIFLAAHGKRGVPTRLFSNESDAVAWLKTFLK